MQNSRKLGQSCPELAKPRSELSEVTRPTRAGVLKAPACVDPGCGCSEGFKSCKHNSRMCVGSVWTSEPVLGVEPLVYCS